MDMEKANTEPNSILTAAIAAMGKCKWLKLKVKAARQRQRQTTDDINTAQIWNFVLNLLLLENIYIQIESDYRCIST